MIFDTVRPGCGYAVAVTELKIQNWRCFSDNREADGFADKLFRYNASNFQPSGEGYVAPE